MDILDPANFAEATWSWYDGGFWHYSWQLFSYGKWDVDLNPYPVGTILRVTLEITGNTWTEAWIYTLPFEAGWGSSGEEEILIPLGTPAGTHVFDVPIVGGQFEQLGIFNLYTDSIIRGLEVITPPPPVFWTNFKGQFEVS